MSRTSRLGEMLVKEQVITPIQLKNALDSQRATGSRLGHELTRLGYIEDNELTSFLSKQYGVSVEDLKAWNNMTDNTIHVGQQVVVSQ